MVNEETLIKKGNCKNCLHLGTTSCPDVLLMESLDLDNYNCISWKSNNKEEE